MISFTVTNQRQIVQGLKQVRQRFSTIVRDARLDSFMERRVLQRFDAGVSPSGVKWAPLLPQTEKRKERDSAGGEAPLVRSGNLRDAIRVIVGSREGKFAVNTGLGFRVGIDDEEASEYGRVHNYGLFSPITKRKLPMRKFIGVSAGDVVEVERLLKAKAAVILGGF